MAVPGAVGTEALLAVASPAAARRKVAHPRAAPVETVVAGRIAEMISAGTISRMESRFENACAFMTRGVLRYGK